MSDRLPSGDRRRLLKSAVAGAALLATPVPLVHGQSASPPKKAPASSPEQDPPSHDEPPLTTERTGSDAMVDVLKALGIEYVCSNPGSSFRGLHESLINYGGNRAPEFITCTHEESSVAMAHGYAKVAGKPIVALAHGTVGLQHAAMAVYNAYCDRVPVYLVVGNTLDATERRPGVEWAHSVQDAAGLVRDFTKWDDLPMSLDHFAESAIRAYKVAMTPPSGPVMLVVDSGLQERPIGATEKVRVPKLTVPAPPQGDAGAVAEAAKLLVAAERPVIVADRAARTPRGLALIVELAELVQAPVVNQAGRMNFPSRHPLNHTWRSRGILGTADVILGLEVNDLWGTVNAMTDQLERSVESVVKTGVKLVSITAGDLYLRSNYQDFQRYAEVDVAMAADAEATLPALIEAVKRLVTDDRRRAFEARGKQLAEAFHTADERYVSECGYGWDASPVSTVRMAAEIWNVIKGEDWALVSEGRYGPQRLWTIDKYHQFIGGSGGAGQGYVAPAAVGAALAHKAHGRISVSIQPDGDLMYAPGVLWTAAHHRIPLLSVMHNNRAYHQEVMHIQRMANRHDRGVDRAHIGTTISDPAIDYAKLAQSMGVYAEGPITDAKDLGPALTRALAVVKRGEPALVDVICQPR